MGLKIVTINIPDQYIDYIAGKCPNRSEAIRQAIKDFLKNEPQLMEELS